MSCSVGVGLALLLLLPVVLSGLLMAAHFLHAGSLLLMAGSLGSLLLLLVRRRGVAWVMQGLLLLAALEWLRTLVTLIDLRQAMAQAGQEVRPWIRLVYILGPVVLFTALSSLVFETTRLKERYRRTPESAGFGKL